MSSSEDPDESDGDVEEVNKRRKTKANLTCYPGTNPAGLKHPPVPKKKKRNRKEQDVVGKLSGADIPFVVTVVGVTTLSNKYKGHVTAYNKCGVGAEKATTDMERDKQGAQRVERLRLRQIRLIEDTFASGQFLRFDPGDSEKRSATAAASRTPTKEEEEAAREARRQLLEHLR
jgi:hypothetical protein